MRSPRVLAAAIAAAVAVTVTGCSGSGHPVGSPSTEPTVHVSLSGGSAQGDFSEIPQIVKNAEPTVVTIVTGSGLGSGVIYRSDGVIATDAHVVAGATNVTVQFADGKQVPGHVVATDPVTDLAVVRVARHGLPAAHFARQLPQVGQLAVVIGTPLGLSDTVTAGIISALNRSLPPAAETPAGLQNLLQTDAPISPGNSGGGIFDAQGQVVGLSEAYVPPSAGAVAIGFATPATTVTDVVSQLLKNGKVTTAYLGVQVQELTPQIAQQLGLTNVTGGVIVVAVASGGPAANAGIAPGDVITKVGQTAVNSLADLYAALRKNAPGSTVAVHVVRNNSPRTLRVTLASRP